MEQDIEKTHDLLTDVGLPSTIADIKHPTEEFVINLMSEFLNTFFIDLNAIQKPSFQQLTSLSLARHNPDIIMLVNLYEVMHNICNEIFITDLNFTDITSPGPKKFRRIAKFLANYVIYVSIKMEYIDEKFEEEAVQRQKVNDLKEQKNKILEAKNEKALGDNKMLKVKEKFQKELLKRKTLKAERKAKIDELYKKLKEIELKVHQVDQHHGNLSAKAITIHQIKQELESKAVRSPEKYEERLQKLTKRVEEMLEKRDVLQEAINAKKPAIRKMESTLSFVNQEYENLVVLMKSLQYIAEIDKVVEELSKKWSETKSIYGKETTSHKETSNQDSNAILKDKMNAKWEQELLAIQEERSAILNQKKMWQKSIEDSQNQQQQIFMECGKNRTVVKELENETTELIKYSKDMYNRQIEKVEKMQIKTEELCNKQNCD